MHRHNHAGFTLVELVITMLVVAILASIAIPAYREHVIKVKRSDAKVALNSSAQRLERCYTRANSYVDAAVPECTFVPYTTPDGTYNITLALAAANQEFILTATPQGAQTDDTRCAVLSVDQKGFEDATGTDGAAKCW
jgi:type IV pilus assembly protein PilE